MPQVKDGPAELNRLLESVYAGCIAEGGSEGRCSATSWSAARQAGWSKNREGNWVKTSKAKKIAKGLISGDFSFGVHAHTLIRNELQTRRDGRHGHLFMLPSGELVRTEIDGEHVHTLTSALDSRTGAESSAHQHVVKLMDGTILVTSKGGKHPHSAEMLETTGVDGGHSHVLVLEDGTEIQSLTVSDYLAMMGVSDMSHLGPMPPVSQILDYQKIYESTVNKAVEAFEMNFEFTEPHFKGTYGGEMNDEKLFREFAERRIPIAMYGVPSGQPAMLLQQMGSREVYTADGEMTKPEDLQVKGNEETQALLMEGYWDGKKFYAVDAAYVNEDISQADFVARRAELEMAFQGIQNENISLMPMKFANTTGEVTAAYEFAKSFPSQALMAKGGFGPRVKDDPNTFMLVETKEYEMVMGEMSGEKRFVQSMDGKRFGFVEQGSKYKEGDLVRVQAGMYLKDKEYFDFMKVLGKAESAMGQEQVLERAMPPLQGALEKAYEVLKKLKVEIEVEIDTEGDDDEDDELEDYVEELAYAEMPEMEAKILKADQDQQMAFGVVLAPDVFDLQGDTISAEEIEKTAHAYLKSSRVIGFRHSELAEADLIESYIARKDFELNGETVKTGSWVIGVHVRDPDTWQKIKSGEVTGFSIGGTGKREALDSDA